MSHSHSHSSQSHDHSHMSSIPRDDSCVEDLDLESAPLNNARRDQSLSIELHSSIGKCNDSTNVLPASSSYSSLPCDGCIPRVLITFPCLAPFLPRLPQEQPSIRMALLLFTFSFVSLFFLYIATFDKCNMGKNLLSMFAGVTSLLAKNDIEYFLDYGTLLGAVRDKHIIPWEFDLDIGVEEAECDKISVLKSQFADAGFELFGRNEVISYKENSVLGYDGYLHMPCVRIYQSQEYYTDIYWYQRVTPQRRKRIQENMKRKLRGEAIIPGDSAQLPDSARTPARPTGPSYDTVDLDSQIIAPYNADSNSDSQDWYCNYEGFTDELPGGCVLASDLFPIHSVSFEGGKHGIPANSENRLTGAYNDWRTPRPKGYKILFCLWMPSSYIAIFFFASTFTVSVSLFVLIYGCTIARGVKQRMLAVWWRNHSAANIRLRNGRH